MYDNLLFLIYDTVLYMNKAGKAFYITVEPKTPHWISVTHAFHCATEMARNKCAEVDLLISSVKKCISQTPCRFNI